MDSFRKTDTYVNLAGKLAGIYQQAVSEGIGARDDIKDFCLNIAKYLEAYLNNYDYALLFKRNMREIIAAYSVEKSTEQEVKTKLLELLSKDGDVYLSIKDYVSQLPVRDKSTTSYKDMLEEIDSFSKIYQLRRAYGEHQRQIDDWLSQVKPLSDKAAQHARDKQYPQAISLFRNCLHLLTWSIEKDHKDLAMVYYNLGRCLYHQNDNKTAVFMLNMAKRLYENYWSSSPERDRQLTKVTSAIQDCEKNKASEVSCQPAI